MSTPPMGSSITSVKYNYSPLPRGASNFARAALLSPRAASVAVR